MENINIQSIQNLLENVATINKKYEEIAKLTGENFNIFRILKIERSEVRMHSALLAELLNPNGSHGCGNKFLKLFINRFLLNDETNLETKFVDNLKKLNLEKCSTTVEFHTGFISETGTEGGRIDILINDNSGNAIIIENKIDAGDQNNQLIRYHKFKPEAPIFYLTKFGISPSVGSIKNEFENIELKAKSEFKCISYKEDILNWLEDCKKEAVNYPMLRETITQYIYLIKYLTNQTMNEQNESELINKIISNPENIESAYAVFGIWEEVKFKILENLKSKLIEIGIKLNIQLKINPDGLNKEGNRLGKCGTGFWFYNNDDEYCIYFYFQNDFEEILYGISTINPNQNINEELRMKIQDRFSKSNLLEGDKEWLWVEKFDEYSNTAWKDILNRLPLAIENKLIEMFSLLNQEPAISLK